MLNALTVDVEEYFHATNLEAVAGPAKWHAMPSRLDYALGRTLDLFARFRAHGTFFVLGQLARRQPDQIRRIAAAGHEIASHGYAHRLVYDLNPRSFYHDVRRTKLLLEDITGREVTGFRAPNFSIRNGTLWAYDELIRAGYRYDSSLYPVRHPRYENTARSTTPEFVVRANGRILVLPLAVCTIHTGQREWRLPIAGGAWWRLFPSLYLRWALQRRSRTSPHSIICYFHPWEIDADQPRVGPLPLLTRIRHYTGLRTLDRKLGRFLAAYGSVPLAEIAKTYELTLPSAEAASEHSA